MIKRMRLLGRIYLNDQQEIIFTSELHDGTPFHLVVSENDIQINGLLDEKDNTTPAFLYVVQAAQQDHRCYLTLPKPSLRFGKSVIVHLSLLTNATLKLESFCHRILNGKSNVDDCEA